MFYFYYVLLYSRAIVCGTSLCANELNAKPVSNWWPAGMLEEKQMLAWLNDIVINRCYFQLHA